MNCWVGKDRYTYPCEIIKMTFVDAKVEGTEYEFWCLTVKLLSQWVWANMANMPRGAPTIRHSKVDKKTRSKINHHHNIVIYESRLHTQNGNRDYHFQCSLGKV